MTEYRHSDARKETLRRYNQSDAKKLTSARYSQSDKGKTKKIEYNQSEAGKLTIAKYSKSDAGKAREARHRASGARKDTVSRYDKSEAGKASTRRYDQSVLGRAARRRYRQSKVGKDRSLADSQKRRVLKFGAFVEDINMDILVSQQNGLCSLCAKIFVGVWPNPLSVSLDHTIPLSRGGQHSYANTSAMHLGCNIKKGTSLLADTA